MGHTPDNNAAELPPRSVKGVVNGLSVDVEDWFQVGAFEEVIERGSWDSLVDRVERNVDRILTFVALDSGDRPIANQSFEPRKSVCHVVETLLEFATRRATTLESEIDRAPDAWCGDERAFRAIVDELLRNAIKAAPRGSIILVQLAGDDRELMLSIVDCGPGLSDKFLCTVGDLFNHPSNIPTDNPLLALDLSALLRANDEVLERLIPVIVMDFFVTVAINRPTGRRSHLVLDEAHADQFGFVLVAHLAHGGLNTPAPWGRSS